MNRDDTRGWQPPDRDAPGSTKIAYLNDIVSYGEQMNSQTLSSKDIGKSIDMISGRNQANMPNQKRSSLTINREKRALREVIANIADIRAIDAYTSDNQAMQNFLGMYNKVWKAVYFESKFPRAMKRCVQWFAAGGYSFISPVYRNLVPSVKSRKAIDFDVLSCNDVLSFQMPEDNNIQRAYAHTIIRFLPEFEAHYKFPKYAPQLRPVAQRRYSGNAAKDRVALAERFRTANTDVTGQGNWSAQMDEIRWTHIRDLSINETKKPIAMGAPGALESYIVPFVGMELPTGDFNEGVRIMRKATEEDCFLYPNLRLMISQKGMREPMYDGPGFEWHAMFPLARFSADEWPWEQGYSLARDIFSPGETRQSFMRGLDQTAKQRFDPSLIYDKNAGLPRKTMEQFDPYEERGRLGVDGEVSGKIMATALPPELMNIPEWAFNWLKTLDDAEDYMLGINAMQNLAKAKIGAASGDAVEKAMEEAGPIVKDISHGMETPMQDIMEMCLALVMQYYPPGRVMQYVGPDGVSREVFDLDPTSLTPSHMPTEDPEKGASIHTKMERTKMFLSNIHATITPGSLHGIVQTPQKLLYLQLFRSGFPIPPDMVAEALDIHDFGIIDGNTKIEKWQNWKKMELEFAAKMKELATSIAPSGPGTSQQQAAAGAGGGAKPGRPPSGKKSPHMATKGSAEGPRAVISES